MTPEIPVWSRKMVTIIAECAAALDKRTTGNGSGFLIWLEGKQWLVTAGHIASGLMEVHKANTLFKVLLCDGWSGSDGLGRAVVLPRDRMDSWIILGDEKSYDVAILDLGTNIPAQLAVGEVECIPEDQWRSAPPDYDYYEIVGSPNSMLGDIGSKIKDHKGVIIRQLPTGYEVRRAVMQLNKATQPSVATKNSHERFYAKAAPVSDAIKLDEIEGVSGGPILGCKKEADGSITRQTMAVQSGWFPKHDKSLVGDYLYLLPDMLKAKGLHPK